MFDRVKVEVAIFMNRGIYWNHQTYEDHFPNTKQVVSSTFMIISGSVIRGRQHRGYVYDGMRENRERGPLNKFHVNSQASLAYVDFEYSATT